MNEAIRTRNPWKTVAMMLLAALVLVLVALASMLRPAPTTEASTPAVHPGVHPGVHATSAGGSGIAKDPFIDRHAEVVATYRGIIPDASSSTKDPYIDRHAEVVASYRGSPR